MSYFKNLRVPVFTVSQSNSLTQILHCLDERRIPKHKIQFERERATKCLLEGKEYRFSKTTKNINSQKSEIRIFLHKGKYISSKTRIVGHPQVEGKNTFGFM